MIDRNVEAIIARLQQRAEAGLKEYGVTTDREDLSADDWLNHLIDELLDAAVYAQRLRRRALLAQLQRLGQEMEKLPERQNPLRE